MSDIIQLEEKHWRKMGQLRARQKTHSGAPVDKFTSTPLLTIDKRYLHKPHVAYGSFEDELTSFICCYSNADYWVLDLMVSSGDPKTLRPVLERCLQHFESRGISQFYYAFPEKWARAYRSFWKDGSDTLKKYTIEDIQVIEANKKSDDWIWEHIMHEYIAPVPFLLRRSYVPCV